METISTTKKKPPIMLNINLGKIINFGKVKQHNWIRFAIFIFAVTPFFFSFFFFNRIPAFIEHNVFLFVIVSILMQIPVLIIGIPLYILYKKVKYPEKVSERRYEFRVSDFKPLHYFFSSFWMSGVIGTIAFLICLIFGLNQGIFIIIVYGFLLLRLTGILIFYLLKMSHSSDNTL